MPSLTPDINYIDNYFPIEFAKHLQKKIKKLQSFSLDGFSLDKKEPPFWFMEFTKNDHFKDEIDFIQKYIPQKIIRGYVNGQTFGQYGSFHKDDGDMTYLYYPCPDWSIEDGGGTEFLLKDDNTLVVYPKFNRMCIFNSKISHRATPNRSFTKLRMTLAFKTENNTI